MPSPLITPMTLLWVTFAITVIALIVSAAVRRRRESLLELARQWGMQYSPRDVFNLAPRVAAHLPVTGAADVQISDLIYGTDSGGGHRCVFSAEYTAGVVRSKARRRCVACVVELLGAGSSRIVAESGAAGPDVPPMPGGLDSKPSSLLQIAASDLPILEQYRSLHPAGVVQSVEPKNDARR